jgi:hypothetical protein
MLRTSFYAFIILFIGMTLSAQSVHTNYFLRNSQTRSSLNPAFHPERGYLGVPFLSDISAGTYTNSLNMDNLVFRKNGESVTFFHPSVSSSEFLGKIPDKSYLVANAGYKLFTLGLYNKRNGFWTFDLGVRTQADLSIPKPLFELLKKGFSQNENDFIKYRIKNLHVSGTAYAEAGAGYATTFLDDRLSVGAKAKLLFGLTDFELNVEQLDISIQNKAWLARAKANLNGSLPGIRPTYNEDGLFDSVESDGVSLSGYGVGLDLGAAYSFLDNKAHLSLAFTDIGFIAWPGSNSMNLAAPDTEINVTPGDYTINSEGENINDQISTAVDDLKRAINFEESGQGGRNTLLRTNMNVGLEYEIWQNNMSLGLLSSTYFGRSQTLVEFTLAANYQPAAIKWFSGALSYSFIHNKLNTVGLALHITPGKGINFFLASDYLLPHVSKEFLPVTSKAANLQIGFSIPLGAPHN